MRAVDCQSFAGGFSLGVVQAGWELAGKREYPGGFGVGAMEGNRRLLGWGWEAQDAEPADWEPLEAEMVFGNPPCSGFSQLSGAIQVGDDWVGHAGVKVYAVHSNGQKSVKWSGIENPINDCMRGLVGYAGRCRGVRTVVLESVQQAGKTGRPLMLELREQLETATHRRWGLWHVFHNNLSLGGVSMRRRYFLVLSRDRFGVAPGQVNLSTLRDAIGDLEQVPLGAREGHEIVDNPTTRRNAFLAAHTEWNAGECVGLPYDRFVEAGGVVPDDLLTAQGVVSCHMRAKHMYAPRRWDYDKPARVVDGMTLQDAVHPALPRTFTHREVARILGYPDSWRCQPAIDAGSTGMKWWGKGIPVGSGRWVAEWAKRSIEGEPGELTGERTGDREYTIDVTNDWKPAKPARAPREPALLTGMPRGRNGQLIAAYLGKYPTADPADVAEAIGCSVGRVHEALAGRG